MSGNGAVAILKSHSSSLVRLWSAFPRLPQPIYTSRRSISVALFLTLSACDPTIEYVPVIPDVPRELREPVKVPVRDAATLRDVALILTDHAEALETANGKITTIDCILSMAEAGRALACGDQEGR